MKIDESLSLCCLRFAPALPLRGTSLREDGLHEAQAAEPNPINISEHNNNTNYNKEPLASCTC
jgi:hypothetical protein